MKVKTLRFKDSKEFEHILEDGSVGTSNIPDVLPDTASLELLKKYYEISGYKVELDYDNLEIVEYDFIEAGEVGADIRNKLSPPNNLVELLEDYFDEGTHKIDKEKVKVFILKEMEQTKISVEYLSNLL